MCQHNVTVWLLRYYCGKLSGEHISCFKPFITVFEILKRKQVSLSDYFYLKVFYHSGSFTVLLLVFLHSVICKTATKKHNEEKC